MKSAYSKPSLSNKQVHDLYHSFIEKGCKKTEAVSNVSKELELHIVTVYYHLRNYREKVLTSSAK